MSLPQIERQAKKPSGMDGKGKAKKTCPIWSANINLDWSSGNVCLKKGGNLNNPVKFLCQENVSPWEAAIDQGRQNNSAFVSFCEPMEK